MNRKFPGLVPVLTITLLLVIMGAGCMEASDDQTPSPPSSPEDTANALFTKAESAMANDNYRTASSLYEKTYRLFTDSDDTDNAILARNGMFRATRVIIEYPHNRTAAEAAMQTAVPNLTETDMNVWLAGRAQTI